MPIAPVFVFMDAENLFLSFADLAKTYPILSDLFLQILDEPLNPLLVQPLSIRKQRCAHAFFPIVKTVSYANKIQIPFFTQF
jgi:hypothetical protein